MTNIKDQILSAPNYSVTDIFRFLHESCKDFPNVVDENVTFNVTRFEIELENEMYEHKY
jgi:hypothetical protein